MTRRVNKFDSKIPTPIALSRKPGTRVDLETRLRKIDQQFQQDQQFAPSSSSTFMISNLKQELSHIKQDVQKLMIDDDYQQKPFKMETNSAFKQQLAYQKQIQEQLRRQIRDLKLKGNESKLRDDRTTYLTKQIQVLKRQQDILQREKQEALQAVSKLKRELSSVKISESLQIQLSQVKRKFDRQKQQKQQLQLARRRLQTQNANLISELSFKTKERQQYQNGASEWRQQKYKYEQQISKLKMAVTNAINNPEWKQQKVKLNNETEKLKMQMANTININEWKQEKSRLQSEISKYKLLSISSGDQVKQQKIRLENQVTRLQAESKKNKELLETKYKSNKEQMISSINSIKDLTEKNYEFVRKINNIESDLSEKSEELRRKQQMVLQQKQQIKTITKEKDTRYNNLMAQFRKLEQTLNRSAQQNLVGMKNTVLSLQTCIRNEQSDKQKLKITIAELNQKIQKLTYNLQEEKKINSDLSEKIKSQMKNYQQKQSKLEKRMSVRVDELSSELIGSKKQIFDKQHMISSFETQIKQLQTYKAYQQKLRLIQMQNVNTSLQINQLSSQIIRLKQTIQNLEVEIIQKNKVIQKLSQSSKQVNSTEIQKVELKYKQMLEDQKQIIEENQIIIIRLQKQIVQLKQNASYSVKMSSPKNSSFDDIFKQHIQQNEQLKLKIKNKVEQIFTLKNLVQDYKRKVDFQKNESQIDRLKNISDEKKIKSHYEIEIQNIQADAECQKRKYQVLQTRLDAKVDQLKKKDEFIQSVIINKVGRDAYPTQLQYITKQVNKFFTGNYGDKLVTAEDEIKILKQKLKVFQGGR